ncbi:capsule biosynthesis protein CapA [Staphylococcus pragensis]|uniref:Capsule biosynthesis protein CapA n=1 Tax=Staphylococcus pragensis TaxID=1611836 RepID=A0A4Z1BAR6_9STAP|nr:Wzz/FepE/Etk N-terminal domain-containing protein [Staphylococcus pragensis]RTX89678.1 capsule biosynthesis protein CapA [Staphylococcus carnosus]TGN24647.1 capsule biosynthesis protein CapA [Staphylococcus pragensis]GGG95926.1 capsular polysaccharide type 5 biosynthesis protein cap5A [Staphylococcus pragensis]
MENSLDLSKFIDAIKNNWKLLVILPIIFMLISLLITLFLMKPEYEANTQVLVNQKDKSNEYMAQEVQSNLQLVNTYAEILKSPRIIDDVAEKNEKYSASDIKEMLEVTTGTDTQILNINVKSESKKDAETVANDIAQVFSKDMPKIMNVDNVSVLSKADGTAKKVSPKPAQNIVIGLVLGLLLAILLIVVKQLFDRRIRTEEDVTRELNIPVLGSIQKLK